MSNETKESIKEKNEKLIEEKNTNNIKIKLTGKRIISRIIRKDF